MSTSASPAAAAISDKTVAWAYKHTVFAACHYLLACQSHGLGSCAMEGFDDAKVRATLDIPDYYSVPVIITAGYPVTEELPKATSRLPPTEVFFDGKFGASTEALFKS